MRKTVLTACLLALAFSSAPAAPKNKKAKETQPPAAPPARSEILKKHVIELSDHIGERNTFKYENLKKAADYLRREFISYGYAPEIQTFKSNKDDEKEYENLIAEKKGTDNPEEIIIFLAHYDTAENAPGADDNASAVAVLLEMARKAFPGYHGKTIRFAAAANEEPPFFKTSDMGSYRYAKLCRERGEKIIAMVCIESVGFFSDEEGSQYYPFPLKYFYPSKGDFISVISNLSSKSLKDKVHASFKAGTNLRTEDIAAPALLVKAVTLSDQWSFWSFGYKGVMVTDTAFYRTKYYHTPGDTWEKLDYKKMEEVTKGLENVLKDLAE
ncbi:MAG: aminopeptidase [Elusimicrobia bacterium CG08_land_8_20_14_0_20_51_18]|nr:MAG: aminopeptidase [Elusimicrobia bacterium CG08_land_8_20_14_0_20_51_18]